MLQLSRLNESLLKILYFVGVGIVCTQVIGLDMISSLLFAATFVIVLILWMISVSNRCYPSDIFVLAIICLALICVLVEGTIHPTPFSAAYFKKYLMFTCTVMFFQVAFKTDVDADFRKYFRRICTVLGLFLIIYFLMNRDASYIFNDIPSDYLTLGMSNPNLTAMFCSCLCINEFIEIFIQKKRKAKALHLFVGLWMVYFILETQSRNCLLILLIFTALLIFTLAKRQVKINKIEIFIILLFPLILVMVYMYLVEATWFLNMFQFLTSEGKNITSRVWIWGGALDAFSQSPIFGAYGAISDRTGVSQMHNTLLDVLASYGSIVFVMLMSYLYKNVGKVSQRAKTKEGSLYMLGFFSTYLMGMGEAALFSGGLGIYMFICVFLMLARSDSPERENI